MTSAILNRSIAQAAIDFVSPGIIFALRSGRFKRKQLALVVVAQESLIPYDHDRSFADNCLAVRHYVCGDEPANDLFVEVALSKARISWRTGKDSHDVAPQERQPGDTVYSGSRAQNGVICACSGVEPRGDYMFAQWTTDAVETLCELELLKVSSELGFFPT